MVILAPDASFGHACNPVLAVDPKKIEALQKPYREFKRRSGVEGTWQATPLWVRHQFQRYYFFNPPKWRVKARSLSSAERMTPSFASIGAVRSGTSFLSSHIFQHPHVALPLAKEISFTETMRELMAHFPTRRAQLTAERLNGGAVTGYCTPVMPNPLWIFLAKSMFPKMQIVVVLRDPVERTFSHWRWDQKRVNRKLSDPHWMGFPDFGAVIESEQETIRGGAMGIHAFSGARAGYLQHSIYAPFLRLLFEKFGREQVFIVDAAELFENPQSVTKRIYAFLSLPPVEPLAIEEQNPGPPAPLPDGIRSRLTDFFRPYNEEVYKLLDKDFGWGA
jgi:hypothetical protein